MSAQAAALQAGEHAPLQTPAPENTRHQLQACAQCLAVSLADGVAAAHLQIVPVTAVAALIAAAPALQFTQHTAAPFLARAPPVPAYVPRRPVRLDARERQSQAAFA